MSILFSRTRISVPLELDTLLTKAIANMPPSSTPLTDALFNIWRFVFAVIVIAVFVVAWLVQGEVIKTPKWARDWSGETPEVQREYAAALMTPVCIIFLLLGVTGFIQMRREDTRVV